MRLLLPKIIATITGHPRFEGDGKWYKKSWSGNLFVLYRNLFWQRCGKNGVGDTIRAESAMYKNENGVTAYEFYTWEALAVHTEALVRKFFKMPSIVFGWEFIPVPQFAFAGVGTRRIPIYSFAIGFDHGDTAGVIGATPQSETFSVSGTNPMLLSVISANSGGTISGVTYNSIAMTSAGAGFATNDVIEYLFFKLAPSTGSNTMTGTSSGVVVFMCAMNYSGCDQSNTGEITGSYTTGSSGASPFNLAITSTAANSWICGQTRHNLNDQVGGTATTDRITSASTNSISTYSDSNQAYAAGSHNLQWTFTGGLNIYGNGFSFAPAASAATVLPYRSLLGVGV